MTHEELLTLDEAAGVLRISPQTLKKYRLQNRAPTAVRVGRHVRWRRVDLDEWIRQQVEDPPPEAA